MTTRTHALLLVSRRCFDEVDQALTRADPSTPHARKGVAPIRIVMDGLALAIDDRLDSADAMKHRIASRLFEQPYDPTGAQQVGEIFDRHLLPHLLPDQAPLHPDNARQVRDLLRLLRQCCETGRLDRQTEIDISTVIEHAATWCPGVAVIETPSTRRVEIENP
jgi:hypothetical protein